MKFNLARIDVSWDAKETVLRFLLDKGLHFDFNNLSGAWYRKVYSFRIPIVNIQCLLPVDHARRWMEVASLTFDLCGDLYRRPEGWMVDGDLQREFLTVQDHATHRIQNILGVNQHPKNGPVFSFAQIRNTELMF